MYKNRSVENFLELNRYPGIIINTRNKILSINFHAFRSINGGSKISSTFQERWRGIRRLILDEDGKSSSRCMIIRDHTAASMQPCILSDVSYCVLTAAITFLEQRVSIVYFSREGRFITRCNKVLCFLSDSQCRCRGVRFIVRVSPTKYEKVKVK